MSSLLDDEDGDNDEDAKETTEMIRLPSDDTHAEENEENEDIGDLMKVTNSMLQ